MYLQGRASEAEEVELRRWREASEEHEQEYQELAELWGTLREGPLTTYPPPVEAVVARARSRSRQVVPLRGREGGAGTRWRRYAAAALVLVALGAGTWLDRRAGEDGQSLDALVLVTGPEEATMRELSDGTIVHLGPGSRLEVVGEAGRRVVWLEGRAFFGVARHEGWPFVVRSHTGEAQVLGTRFEFSTDAEDVRVVVVEGRVAFSASGEKVEVEAGQMSVGALDAPPVVNEVPDVVELLGWMGQSLVFHDTPLSQAAGEIEARYGMPVEVRGEELARRTISGGFENRSFEYVVSTICRVVAAECTITPERAVIQRPM